MRRTHSQAVASMFVGAVLAFLSTWGLTQCAAMAACHDATHWSRSDTAAQLAALRRFIEGG